MPAPSYLTQLSIVPETLGLMCPSCFHVHTMEVVLLRDYIGNSKPCPSCALSFPLPSPPGQETAA